MAKSVRCEWYGFEAQHRWEDCPVIACEVLEVVRPKFALELGTAGGGFAAFLAGTLAAWGGSVVTVDIAVNDDLIARLEGSFANLSVWRGDCLSSVPPILDRLIRGAEYQPCLVYCDDGNKPLEIELYAPLIPVGSLIGCHDYEDEVPSAWVEPHLTALGFAPYRHEAFEALAHPVDYPRSLSRFWIRERLA